MAKSHPQWVCGQKYYIIIITTTATTTTTLSTLSQKKFPPLNYL